MDPSEPADLHSCEVQLRGILERVRGAFYDESYPRTITQTLVVMPDLLKQLKLLHKIVQAHLGQLADSQDSAPARVALVELRKRTDRVLEARTYVDALANLAKEARKARDTAVRIQTPSELQEERTVAAPAEHQLIEELQGAIDDLHKVNQELSLGRVDLPRPDQGGGALVRNQPDFDSRRALPVIPGAS
jgi:hypothetical protein